MTTLDPMSTGQYEELYLASVRVPLVLAIFLGLWGLVILVLQALEIDYSSVLRKASGASVLVLLRVPFVENAFDLLNLCRRTR